MKTMSLKIAAAMICASVLFSCGNGETSENKQEHADHQHEHEAANTNNSAMPTPISPLVQHYIHVKNALVSGNADEAKNGAQAMADAIGSIDASTFTAEQKAAWEAEWKKVKENANHIAETNEVAHQREHLGGLTEGVLALIKTFGGGKTLYYEYCPMANNDKGGYWISENKEIRNPYFGDEMLECGQVKEELK